MNREVLSRLAAKYIWWKTPEAAIEQPRRVAAQVMELGDWDDVVLLDAAVGEDFLREVVERAESGQLSERSWTYWHYRLGLATLGHVPALPTRRVS